jgi:hypothetical protein
MNRRDFIKSTAVMCGGVVVGQNCLADEMPLNPSSGVYVIGSPLVEKATIQLAPQFYKGGTFTIIAHNVSKQNYCIQSDRLNGKPLNRPWITHDETSTVASWNRKWTFFQTKLGEQI